MERLLKNLIKPESLEKEIERRGLLPFARQLLAAHRAGDREAFVTLLAMRDLSAYADLIWHAVGALDVDHGQ